MDSRDAGVPREVLYVQGEQLAHSVYQHRSDKACIMNLNPGDGVLHD
ncbi:MAG: hypothetical protein ACKV22_03205 [Bryobacteraceae bacterium]